MPRLTSIFCLTPPLALLLVTFWLPVAQADSALSYRLGTFGFGLDFAQQLKPDLTLRAGYNLFVHGRTADSNGVHFDASLKINAASLMLDWHYAHSPWRLSVGITQSGPHADANGSATGNITFNGQSYSADQLGTLRATIKPAHAIAPYIGMGRGRSVASADRFNLLFDLGAMYIGSPNAQVAASCGNAVTASQCSQLLTDIQAEVATQERKWRDLRWWPVVAVGFSMRW